MRLLSLPLARPMRAIACEDSVTSGVLRKRLKSNACWVNKLPINIPQGRFQQNPQFSLTFTIKELQYCYAEIDEICTFLATYNQNQLLVSS